MKVALLDKSDFPRDKICGDAIGGRVKKVLKNIDPDYLQRLEDFPGKNVSAGWTLYAPNGKSVHLEFVNSGYVSKRIDFDKFLFDLVVEQNQVTVISNFEVVKISSEGHLKQLTGKNGEQLQTKLIIGCDGAHSVVAKQLAGFKVDLNHYSGAVRSYYTNIKGISNPHAIEIHLINNYLPGYFWIFPLGESSANVGFGMLSEDIRKRKINLKNAFSDILSQSSHIAERFKDATQQSELAGFGLPLGGLKRKISGDNFMLCGDAASLIDPLNGEGIGNAMLSGRLAATQAEQCFHANDFSETEMSKYDDKVYYKLGKELKSKWFMQKVFNRPWLINSLVTLAISNPRLKDWAGRRL